MINKVASEILKNDYNLNLLEIVTPSGDGFSMYVTPRFTFSYAQGYEKFSTRIVRNFVKKCDLFVDVGANYGYYSLLAADSNKAIKIIAVEPIEENFEILNKNLIHNNIGPDQAKCIKAVVSSGTGKINIYKSEASDNSSVIPHPSSETLEKLEVDAVRLDDVLENEQFNSLFIKTDTEGYELEVLKGLASTYQKCEDITILLELNPELLKLAGSSSMEVIEYLYTQDFSIYGIDDKEFRYYPLDVAGNLDMMLSVYEASYFNVLCVKRKKVLSVLFFSHLGNIGGAERDLLDAVRGLSERKVLCTAVLPAEGYLMELLKENGCAVFVVPKWERSKVSWWWCGITSDDFSKRKLAGSFDAVMNQIVPEVKKICPDVIFSQTIVAPWGAVCASLLNIPHVLSAREYGVLDHNLQFYFGFEESISALYNGSNEVFCITKDVSNTLFGSDEDKKTTVVYSDIQVNRVSENPIDIKSDIIFSPDWESGVTIGVFGTICKGKGQEDIVRACIELNKTGFNVKCILAGYIGDNEYLKNIELIIEQSGFSDRFVRNNFVDDPYQLMEKVDIVVSCAVIEALGRTLIEAILLRKPIIYANSGGPKEIFIDGIHGLAYEVGDHKGLANKILLTINNKEETQNRIQLASEYVAQKFNSENHAGKIYKKLIELKEKEFKGNNNAVIDLINASIMKDTSEILLQPKLYYARTENSFNEKQSVLARKIPFGLFSISFTLPDHGINYLRLDPTEEFYVDLKIYKIVITTMNNEIIINPEAKLNSNGIQRANKSWRFLNFDPQVFLNFDFDVKEIEIIGEVNKIDNEQVIEILNHVIILEKEILIKTKDHDLFELTHLIQEMENQFNNAEKMINSLYNSYSWKITKPLRWLYPWIFKFFYFFFPYGSKRWAIIKRMVQIIHRIIFRSPRRIVQTDTKTVNKNTTETLNLDIQKKPDKTKFYTSNSILFIGHDAYLAGAEVLLLSLVKWFSEHTAIRIKIILLRGGILLDKFSELAPTIVWEEFIQRFPDAENRREKILEFTGKVNLIYGNTVVAPSIYDELAFLSAPFITHIHELEKSIKMYVEKRTIEKMRLFTTGFIACSKPVGANLIDNHFVEQEKITTIYEFVEDKKVTLADSKYHLREKLGLTKEGLVVFGCGTIYWRKGVDLFIDTAIRLKQKGLKNFHFYWIGENIWDVDKPSLKFCSWNYLQTKIRDAGVQDHVTFLGVKENTLDYFLSGDLYYLPSREDPYPLVCLEAAQCGLPIICFEDAGGMPDFVQQDAGFVVPFEDVNRVVEKIMYLNRNRRSLYEIGLVARNKFLERHTIDIAASEILNLCRKIGNFSPAISVIVPNYNCEKYLKKRLDSIFNQTFKDFEIILLDDSSTDNSLFVINKYLHSPSIHLFQNQKNSGNPFIQWHKGYSLAKGEILWFAEADDFCDDQFLHKLMPCFNDHSVALAYCDSFIIDESDKVTGDYSFYTEPLDPNHWKASYQVTGQREINYGLGVKNSIPNASAVLIRRSCVTEQIFNETYKFKFSGDWYFYIQLVKEKSISFYSEKLNYHRKHKQTVSTKFNSDKSSIQLLLKEAELVHNNILENYSINVDFIEKWRFYIEEQIHGFYPNTSKEEFDKYYPFNLIEEKIKKTIIKSEISKRLVFLTTNDGSSNGGSEQLWIETAIECRKRGHEVMVVIKNWYTAPYFIQVFNNIGIKVLFKGHDDFNQVLLFKPDLLVVSTGDQDEGIEWYDKCRVHNVSYIIINQLTKEPEYCPIRRDINEQVKNGYLGAAKVFFTCNNNHKVMEKRLNCKIPNASIHYNPFHVDRNTDIPFPPLENGLKIAIVANLLRIHKGQHLAIELFNLKKWKERPIQLNLYGEGYDEEVLKAMTKKYGLNKVLFHKHTHDLLTIWRDNHAIFMPSFMEGLPLVLVGAMICARVPILTDIGAHREVVDDNINGFIAKKPTVEALDEALERAYQKSEMWEEMGQRARERILSYLPPNDPIDDFIAKIIPLANKK